MKTNARKLIALAIAMVLMVTMIPAVTVSAGMTDEAKEIELNAEVKGNLVTKDTVNYYKVTLPTDGNVSFTFKHENLIGFEFWKVDLYDSDTETIASVNIRGNEVTTNSIANYVAKGDYYVRVKASSHSSVEYKLTVNYTPNIGDFEIEKNDVKESATPIGSKTLIGNLRSKDDIDWYKITFKTDGNVSFTFKHENLIGFEFWKVELCDSDTKTISSINVRGNEVSLNSIANYVAKGTYYIKVKASSYDATDYKLTVNYTPNSGDFEIENNDTKENATLIDNNALIGNLSSKEDVDWYKFTLVADGKVSFTFKHENLIGFEFWKVELSDSESNIIASINVRGNDVTLNSTANYIIKGTYYVRVRASSYDAADYKLTIVPSEGAKIKATKPEIGEKLGNVLNSDIKVYIDDKRIPSYVIGGNVAIVAEDLAKYGFDVSYNGTTRTLAVVRNAKKAFDPIKNIANSTSKNGSIAFPYVYTDIKVLLGGAQITSYAINGTTVILFEDLSLYGKISWDSTARETRIKLN
ncbi:hypothetical protein FACS1894219_00900 [Clostridia bacterium]|nr:hypothetical protein FACS1894219_00900 [Clostridia bacterium]